MAAACGWLAAAHGLVRVVVVVDAVVRGAVEDAFCVARCQMVWLTLGFCVPSRQRAIAPVGGDETGGVVPAVGTFGALLTGVFTPGGVFGF